MSDRFIDPQEVLDASRTRQENNDARRRAKQQSVASRIAKRALREINNGNIPVIVKGGRLGLLATRHDANVYALVGAELEAQGVKPEIHQVDEIFFEYGVRFRSSVADVVTPVSIQGREITPVGVNPVKDPTVFGNGLLGRFFSYGEDYEVTQVYPPEPAE